MTKEVKQVKDLLGTDAAYNPRDIDEDDLIRLQKTMREYGDLGGIVLNVRTGTLIGGHQRKKVMDPSWTVSKEEVSDLTGTIAVGHVITPFGRFTYREVDWSEDKEKAANLVANHSAGRWNFEKKKEIVLDLQRNKFDISKLGRPEKEIQHLVSEMEQMQNEKMEHSVLKQAKEDPSSVDDDDRVTVKVNLEFHQVKFLDDEFGKNKRSEAIRDAVQYYIDTWAEHHEEE